MEAEKQLTVSELVDGVIPCIEAKQYSKAYVDGFRQIFKRLLTYCNDKNITQFSAEMTQQFLKECYGVQPGTVERRCSRPHRAMELLSDYQHFGTVMIRRRLDRAFPTGLQSSTEGYLKQMELRGYRKNTVLSHRKMLLRFTDFLDSIGVTEYKVLTSDDVTLFIKSHPLQLLQCRSDGVLWYSQALPSVPGSIGKHERGFIAEIGSN